MKTFIVYNSIYDQSEKIAKESYDTFLKYKGWEPQLHDGCYPSILNDYDKKYNIKTGELTKKYSNQKLALTKKACFYSHYELWVKCIELNEPIAIVEHDTVCCGDLNIPNNFNMNIPLGIQLTTDSMLIALKHYNNLKNTMQLNINGDGLHKVFYVHPHGKKYFAGGTGYILTPEACKIIVDWCKTNGWTQNDLLFDDELFSLYYIHPSPVKYIKEKELNSSSKKI